MVRTILLILCLLQLVIGIVYFANIINYLNGHYNYDGFRYAFYIIAFDVGFFMTYILANKNKEPKLAKWVFISAIIQNLNLGMGVVIIPFSGAILSLLTIAFVLLKGYSLVTRE